MRRGAILVGRPIPLLLLTDSSFLNWLTIYPPISLTAMLQFSVIVFHWWVPGRFILRLTALQIINLSVCYLIRLVLICAKQVKLFICVFLVYPWPLNLLAIAKSVNHILILLTTRLLSIASLILLFLRISLTRLFLMMLASCVGLRKAAFIRIAYI